jgi:hypothetical protein
MFSRKSAVDSHVWNSKSEAENNDVRGRDPVSHDARLSKISAKKETRVLVLVSEDMNESGDDHIDFHR